MSFAIFRTAEHIAAYYRDQRAAKVDEAFRARIVRTEKHCEHRNIMTHPLWDKAIKGFEFDEEVEGTFYRTEADLWRILFTYIDKMQLIEVEDV